jgi:predicted transposase YdaD
MLVEFNRFDVATKELVWEDPSAWLQRLGIACAGVVELIDSDITTLTASADKVIRVPGPEPYLVNIELHSYHDSGLARTLWYRQVALDYRHDLTVLTVIVLLCKEANSPHLTGTYERKVPDGFQTNRYNYRVVRLWQDDPELYLNSNVTLVPLAPLADVSPTDLPRLVQRMKDRIGHEPRPQAAKLLTAAYLLMGLRYEDELTNLLFEGIEVMKQSTTYQSILKEGRQEGRQEGESLGRVHEAQRILLLQGTKRFGEPSEATAAALEEIQDVERLETLGVRILEPAVVNWNDLLSGS